MSRWQRFWFAPGGRYAAAVVRMGLAVAVMMTVRKLGIADYQLDLAKRPLGLYDPDGLLMVLGSEPPPGSVLNILRLVAYTSSVMMLVGLASRTSTLVSCVSALALASYKMSFVSGWSHQLNVVFIAQIAFLLCRSGDVLSIDAWLAKRRGRSTEAPQLGYQWHIRLSTLAVALMFFGAFIHKMAMAKFTLRWALSDNLRNHLLLRFDKLGVDRTFMADWLIQEPWRYETAAMLNLISQFAPILAFFYFRRPLIRAAVAIFFLAETLALGVVMDLWNLNWLPLLVVFIDWDALFGKLGWVSDPLAPEPESLDPRSPARSARIGRGFLIGYLIVLVTTSFVPKLDVALKTFPFTRFPMFSIIRAKQPYGTPQTFEFYGNRIEAVDATLAAKDRAWLDQAYGLRWLQRRIRKPSKLKSKLAYVEKLFRKRFKARGFTASRVHLALFQAAAPPDSSMVVHRVGIIADKPRDKAFRSLRGRIADDRRSITIDPVGFDSLEVKGLALIVDDNPEAEMIAANGDGQRFKLPERKAESILVLIDVQVGDETLRFVVDRDPEIRW